LTTLAATLINWDALWKIVVGALVGGTGVVLAFGVALLALERAETARSRTTRFAQRALAGACGALCVATIAMGLYAITHKPAPKAAPNPRYATQSGAMTRSPPAAVAAGPADVGACLLGGTHAAGADRPCRPGSSTRRSPVGKAPHRGARLVLAR
jgi:hypothetical protein